MGTYKLTIHNENIRAILEKNNNKYFQHLKGLEIKASNENEAREIAAREFNIMRCDEDFVPSMIIPEGLNENFYGDLWLNPNYTKAESLN